MKFTSTIVAAILAGSTLALPTALPVNRNEGQVVAAELSAAEAVTVPAVARRDANPMDRPPPPPPNKKPSLGAGQSIDPRTGQVLTRQRLFTDSGEPIDPNHAQMDHINAGYLHGNQIISRPGDRSQYRGAGHEGAAGMRNPPNRVTGPSGEDLGMASTQDDPAYYGRVPQSRGTVGVSNRGQNLQGGYATTGGLPPGTQIRPQFDATGAPNNAYGRQMQQAAETANQVADPNHPAQGGYNSYTQGLIGPYAGQATQVGPRRGTRQPMPQTDDAYNSDSDDDNKYDGKDLSGYGRRS